jgi:CHASE2 domain-containing sensor protein
MNLFSPTDVLLFLLMMACGFGFYRLAEVDNAPGILWAGASVAAFAFSWLYLREGWIGNLVGQVFVFFGIAVVRAARDYRNRRN